jgi:hypothetical protein
MVSQGNVLVSSTLLIYFNYTLKFFLGFFIGYSLLQPHFGLSVRVKPTFPKVGSWSPTRLPKIQSSSSKVKTPCVEVFFISMKRSWSVDVQNGFMCAIWTSASQVMGKRRAGSQTGSLNPTTKSRESTSSQRPLKECDMVLESSQGELQLWFKLHSNRRSEPRHTSSQSPGTPTQDSFRTPPWESRENVPFGCSLHGRTQRILYGGKVVASPESGPWWVKCVKMPVACPNTQGCCWMWTNPLVVGFGCRFKLDNLVPLPSLIPGLLARPSTPL